MAGKKILHIVRHAKSSWDLADIDDIDRPLTDKGIWKAYLMSEKIKSLYPAPGLIVSSPAIRALHTAMIFAAVCRIPYRNVLISETLYNMGSGEIIDYIRKTDNNISSMILFGHNPDFTDIVNTFAKKPVKTLPTTGAVTFEFDTDLWEDAGADNAVSQVIHFSEE
jgi:phosphohistidine phosphatase